MAIISIAKRGASINIAKLTILEIRRRKSQKVQACSPVIGLITAPVQATCRPSSGCGGGGPGRQLPQSAGQVEQVSVPLQLVSPQKGGGGSIPATVTVALHRSLPPLFLQRRLKVVLAVTVTFSEKPAVLLEPLQTPDGTDEAVQVVGFFVVTQVNIEEPGAERALGLALKLQVGALIPTFALQVPVSPSALVHSMLKVVGEVSALLVVVPLLLEALHGPPVLLQSFASVDDQVRSTVFPESTLGKLGVMSQVGPEPTITPKHSV